MICVGLGFVFGGDGRGVENLDWWMGFASRVFYFSFRISLSVVWVWVRV